MNVIEIQVGLPARDHLKLHLQTDPSTGAIQEARLQGVGCTEFLQLLAEWRPKLRGALQDVPLPTGIAHSRMLLREAIQKAQGTWKFPYADDELCHCRAVSTERVDGAIVGGCHTVEAIRAATSANTSCGTCLNDVKAVLAYRLNPPKI